MREHPAGPDHHHDTEIVGNGFHHFIKIDARMSDGTGNGRMVMRMPSLPVLGAFVVGGVAVLSTLGGWLGSYVTGDRTATATVEQLKAKNDTQDLRIEAGIKHLEARVDNLKAVYDQRFETILHRMQEAQQSTATERSEVRQSLARIESDLSQLRTDNARIVERQGMQPARSR